MIRLHYEAQGKHAKIQEMTLNSKHGCLRPVGRVGFNVLSLLQAHGQ